MEPLPGIRVYHETESKQHENTIGTRKFTIYQREAQANLKFEKTRTEIVLSRILLHITNRAFFLRNTRVRTT